MVHFHPLELLAPVSYGAVCWVSCGISFLFVFLFQMPIAQLLFCVLSFFIRQKTRLHIPDVHQTSKTRNEGLVISIQELKIGWI